MFIFQQEFNAIENIGMKKTFRVKPADPYYSDKNLILKQG